MAGVICPSCQEPNTDGEALCNACGYLLADDGGQAPDPSGATQAPPAGSRPGLAKCPACGAAIPDAANLVCVDCLEPLTPRSSSVRVTPTHRAKATLRLLFAGQPVDVPRPGSVLLGRDPVHSPVAALFAAHDNVSRRHASVGIESDGTAWVRDEHSTNGTFVDNKPVPSGHTAPLSPGDQLRIASDVVARIEFGHPGRPA